MSNLLEQASLVLIPSGYKEDIVYSQIPLDGAGDLSFTRASNGTRINSQGLVEVAPWNLVEYSENFDNGFWVKQNSIAVTANTTTAPNGTTTADTLEKAGGSGGSNYYYIVSVTNSFEQLTNFFYVKHKSGSGIIWLLGKNSASFAFYDVINGTALSKSSGMTTSIESVGNGWYKCIFSQSYVGATTTEFGIGLCLVDGTPNYNATTAATQSVYIWGAQSAVGSTAKPYFPTTDRLNVPRLTYQNGGGGCPSLLLEKQSTNILNYSEQFDNAYWGKLNTTITANNTTSPDGTTNADKLASNGASSDEYMEVSGLTTTVATYTSSLFVKNVDATTSVLMAVHLGEGSITSELTYTWSTGAVVISGTNKVSGKATNYGNGWVRLEFTYTIGASVTGHYYRVYAQTGTSTKAIYIYGAQLEASSYSTSYIPTTSSSATRVADACSKTGISSLIGQTEGVVFVQGSRFALDSVKSALFAALEKTSTGATMRIQYSQSLNILYADIFDGTSFSAQLSGPFIEVGQTFKAALAYKNNDFAFAVNGSIVATDTSGSVPATDDLKINTSQYNNLDAGLQESQLVLFKTRLSNSDLIALTTL